MDSGSGAARELLEILQVATTEWSKRPWVTRRIEPSPNESATPIDGPTFCYLWEREQSPVEVTVLTHGAIESDRSRCLLIDLDNRRLRVRIPDRAPLELSISDWRLSDELANLTSRDGPPILATSTPWREELDGVSAAMRMIGLAGQVAAQAMAPEAPPGAEPSVATALHAWFSEQQGQPLRLAKAAKHLGTSERMLVRQLKKTTGAGFSEHATLHRLVLARNLLMRTDRSVVDIAHAAGFSSREPFIRAFSKSFGWTPLQFRKAWVQAAASGQESPDLCRFSDREEGEWLAHRNTNELPHLPASPSPTTLVVGNALAEIVELFQVTPQGGYIRQDVLDGGRMVLITETNGGSLWHVRSLETPWTGYFVAPGSHGGIVISSSTPRPK